MEFNGQLFLLLFNPLGLSLSLFTLLIIHVLSFILPIVIIRQTLNNLILLHILLLHCFHLWLEYIINCNRALLLLHCLG